MLSIFFTGRISGLSIAGIFQISDSMGYWICANSFLDYGNFGFIGSTGEWCQRRSIYPTLLSGIAWLAQREIFYTLLIQAAILSIAIFFLVHNSAKFLGFLGAFVCAFLIFRYASRDAFPLTMSENAGLIFGCTGFALLIRSSCEKSLSMIIMGIALFSIAMSSRMGAVFIIPLLILWVGIAAKYYGKPIWKWVLLASISIFTGFFIQSLIVYLVGGSPSNSYGNFSYTLYGLASGGKGWQQVLLDYPNVQGGDAQVMKSIYALAWQKIMMEPKLIFIGIHKNFSHYIVGGTYGFEKFGSALDIVKAFWWLSWIPIICHR
jgi:hypothetical protein